jgi:hypothetical protein
VPSISQTCDAIAQAVNGLSFAKILTARNFLENLALRPQLLALHAQRSRPRLGFPDRLFWVTLRQLWSGWRKPLVVVTPETVVRWHRTGFRWYWAWR